MKGGEQDEMMTLMISMIIQNYDSSYDVLMTQINNLPHQFIKADEEDY